MGLTAAVVDRDLYSDSDSYDDWWYLVCWGVVVDLLATVISHRRLLKVKLTVLSLVLEVLHMCLSLGRLIWVWFVAFKMTYNEFHDLIDEASCLSVPLMWVIGGALVTLQVLSWPIVWVCRERECCGLGELSKGLPQWQAGAGSQLYGDPIIDGDFTQV